MSVSESFPAQKQDGNRASEKMFVDAAHYLVGGSKSWQVLSFGKSRQ